MQCPACNHTPPAGSDHNPTICPACGGVYMDAIRAKAAQNAAKPPAAKPPAVSAVVRDAMREYQGAQPVVVVDVNMSFNSMVLFMIKWALAAIPAMIILFLIGAFILAILGGIGAGMR